MTKAQEGSGMDLPDTATAPEGTGVETAETEHEVPSSDAAPQSNHRYCHKVLIYENIQMAYEGKVLCTLSRRRADWYVNKGLATYQEGDTDRKRIDLLFRPRGMGHHGRTDETYFTKDREEECVVCGADREHGLTLHHIVPREYRRYMPPCYKSHNSADVVAVCDHCHHSAEDVAGRYRGVVDAKYSIPPQGLGIGEAIPPNMKAGCHSSAILRQRMGRQGLCKSQIPDARIEEMYHLVCRYLCSPFCAYVQTRILEARGCQEGVSGWDDPHLDKFGDLDALLANLADVQSMYGEYMRVQEREKKEREEAEREEAEKEREREKQEEGIRDVGDDVGDSDITPCGSSACDPLPLPILSDPLLHILNYLPARTPNDPMLSRGSLYMQCLIHEGLGHPPIDTLGTCPICMGMVEIWAGSEEGTVGTTPTLTGETVTPEEARRCDSLIEAFILGWREDFVREMRPTNLMPGWSVNMPFTTNENRTD
ncbi:hypothetical protein KIPB_000033 [Kipferlia bialata]|uniref:Uncharacterized protein n=1 Tax=Kipferlia bialata TaxID=797122 RepID=A0A9K3CN64_9EUKA|nr:hypothetical protein KIPB_000033 [Kipferlia bialata]|eukprot:g33.t1